MISCIIFPPTYPFIKPWHGVRLYRTDCEPLEITFSYTWALWRNPRERLMFTYPHHGSVSLSGCFLACDILNFKDQNLIDISTIKQIRNRILKQLLSQDCYSGKLTPDMSSLTQHKDTIHHFHLEQECKSLEQCSRNNRHWYLRFLQVSYLPFH